MIEEALYSRLSGYSGLTALLGSAGGGPAVFPVWLPEDPPYPCVTFTRISATRPVAMGSNPGIVLARYQVDVWGLTFEAVRNAADQVRQALLRLRATISSTEILDSFLENEDQVAPELVNGMLVYRVSLDFTIDYRES